MRTLTCAATRRRLDAYQDGELPVDEQIAVSAHLDWCDECSAASTDLQAIGAALRSTAPGRVMLAADASCGVNTTMVLNRLKAERALPLVARFELMCQDLHVVYAGFGATVAAFVCVFSFSGMMKLTAAERPDSLAGIVNVMAMRLECDPVSERAEVTSCRARFAERFHRSNESAEEDAVFALDAVVITQGRLESLTALKASSHEAASDQAKRIEGLIDLVSRARFDPPSLTGVPWLVTDTTVRAPMPRPGDQNLVPAAKKRAAAANQPSPALPASNS